MMTKRMKELFQKDKYQLVDRIILKKKQIEVLEKTLFSKMQDCLYQFIDYYTQNELDRTDLKVIADNFLQYSNPVDFGGEEWLNTYC